MRASRPPKYAFYPGCCGAQGEGRALSRSALACCEAMGLNLAELPGWTCCGGPELIEQCPVGSAALAVRNLALAARAGAHMLAICPACVSVMRKGMRQVAQQPGLAEHMAGGLAELGLMLPTDQQVRHLLGVMIDDIGPVRIRRGVVRPLTGIRVACYYGHGMADPLGLAQRESGRQGPLEMLMEWLGAEVVEWGRPEGCCGPSPAGGGGLSEGILSEAAGAGAECISAACPMCAAALQHAASERDPQPVFFAQLAAGAFGLPIADAGLRISRHARRAVVRMRRKRADGLS